ncbi:MAG: ABC-type transport auxiliary lipoprotein family protein [Pseudomonadota bacterium]
MMYRLCFAAMTFVLSACVSVLPEPTVADALYRIPVPDPVHVLDTDVLVHEPDAPRVFAGGEIASEASDGGFRLVPGAEWADRPTRLLQGVLIDAFDPTGRGSAFSAPGLSTARLELSWRVVDLHLTEAGAVCRMVVSLHAVDERQMVARETVSASRQAPGGGGENRIAALQSAATDCVDQTAAFIVRAQTGARERPGDQATAVWSFSGTGR